MRAKQIVVVGDSKQLPPTSFFDRALQETDTSDDEEDVDGIESILDMAQKIWMPARRLRWHYRSRHESLIHFSNQEFYDNDLVIFPRAETSVESSGIRLFQVNGTYVGQKNPAEVDAILEAVLLHARQRPELSLGIVTMNKPQTDLLSEALDDYARKNPEVEAFRNRWDCSLEPLIIKNLENIQGDERDVIMISTLYGQDAEGRFFQRFGPINSAFGHRRLNVLFTRAKQHMQIFTSLDPDKILTEGDRKSLGVRALKSFLRYSRDGIIRTTESSGPSLKQPDSVFEEFVIRRLIKHGYQVVPQYGVAGFFIDIAVRNPRCSDTFLLGIECDGAAFHSSKSARDRDRNRQEILESMGWEIYRIWSSDWFLNEDGEMSKLLQHLQALSTKVQMRHEPTTPRV
jgi:very-short-patch-repair endonuclease